MKPDHARLLQTAWDLDRAGRSEEALEAYRAFLRVEPGKAVAWADLGGLLLVLDRCEEALEACRRALKLDPAHRTAQVNLASALYGLGRKEEAEARCRALLLVEPGSVPGRQILGQCLLDRGDVAGVRAVLAPALAAAPDAPGLWALLKKLAIREGDWPEIRRIAEWEWRQMGLAGPVLEHHRAHFHLMFGEMAEGWRAYEARLEVPGLIVPTRDFTQPRWGGEPFPGRTLLLHWEQGFGDTVMFLRYAALAKARGGRVVAAVQKELADLAATCPGVDQVVPHGDPLPPFDLQVPLPSLPLVFGTQVDSVPAEVPYLDVPAVVPDRDALLQELAQSQGRTRIGLAWAGNPLHLKDRERSLPPEALLPLKDLPGVAWHSFQMGAFPAPLPGMIHLSRHFLSFADTAYALSGMDLVIAVDTVLAHLAGALGVPTLLLLPFQPDFRWLLGRSDSPWYPTLRIYRQPQPGDWATVIQDVVRDLS